MNALELWLVRHGETVWQGEGRVQGQSDPPLSAQGVEQAQRLGSRLRATAFTAVYSSDLLRASATAQLALPGAALLTDPRLRELAFGAWEGQTWAEVERMDGARLQAWWLEPYRNAPTGGEPYDALSKRVQAWLGSLPRTGRVIAFTHGGVIRSLLYALTGTPASTATAAQAPENTHPETRAAQRWRFDPGPTSLSKLVLGEYGAILTTIGDVAHLEPSYPALPQQEKT